MYARFFRWASDRIAENGVVAFISNRSFIDGRTFDGFRAVVAKEFNEIHVVDLGGDVRANPKLSGTKHNVFGIQTGVAIGFLVKRAKAQGCRVFYVRRPEMETAEEKLSWLGKAKLSELPRTEIEPDAKHNWLNLTDNDFDSLMPLISKEAKTANVPTKQKAIVRTFSMGVTTNRDDWLYDKSPHVLESKVRFFLSVYARELERVGGQKLNADKLDRSIKWTRRLTHSLERRATYSFDGSRVRTCLYRPFSKENLYFAVGLNEYMYDLPDIFPSSDSDNRSINISVAKDFRAIASDQLVDLHFVGDTMLVPMSCFDQGQSASNITDWALKQFKDRYKSPPSALRAPSPARGGREKTAITKEAIFHYVYAVLHDPVYREKYAQNLKREFPRIPFYADFWRWAEWGRELMELHIGYEAVAPWPLMRTDTPDEKARKNGAAPKAMLKADKDIGRIALDSETALTGIPPEAWNYKLGNRSALEWVLDQYKEKTPKDPTIRAKFNTYRFADYKQKVIDLLSRVTRVSVETQAIVEAMKSAQR